MGTTPWERGRVDDAVFTGGLDAAPVMVWVCDARGACVFVNEARRSVTGEGPGCALEAAVHAEDVSGWRRGFAGALAGERGGVFEYRLRGRDGAYAWVMDTCVARRDEAGVFCGLLGWTTDISTRHDAEQRMAVAVEASPTPMIMVDPAGRIVMVNAQAERLFGYARDELMGASIEMLVPESFRAVHPGYRQAFVSNPKARPMGAGRDLYAQRKDASMVPVEIGLSPIQTRDGVFVLSSIVDISQRNKTEQALRESEARLSGVIESAMDAIITVDSTQRIVLFNAAAERMFRCRADQAMGQTIDRFVPERFRREHRGHIEGFGRTGTTSRRMGALGSLSGVRTDGEEFPIEASISQIVSEGERLYTVILRDITERVRSEAALRGSEERYRAVSELSTDFAYAMRLGADGTARMEWATDAFVKITGYTPEELERRGGWRALVLPEDMKLFERQAEVVAGGNPETSEFRLLTRTGEIRRIRNLARPVADSTGRVDRVVGAAQDITEKHDAELRQQVMMAELDHRVKNNLSIVLSIAARTAESAATMNEFNESFAGRLQAMARVHGALARGRWEGAGLRELTRQTMEVHAAKEQVKIEGDDIVLAAWQAQPLGLVLHELATNAVKYGALSQPGGLVTIRWEVVPTEGGGRQLKMAWEESNGPPVTEPASRGFGSVLIERGIPYELRGSATLVFRKEGVCCEIVAPLGAPGMSSGSPAGRA